MIEPSRSDRYFWDEGDLEIVDPSAKARPMTQHAVEQRLYAGLCKIVADEKKRLNGVVDKLIASVKAPKQKGWVTINGKAGEEELDIDALELSDALAELISDLVNAQAYAEAAKLGADAVPGVNEWRDVADTWIGHTRKYASLVPDRIRAALNEAGVGKTGDDLSNSLTTKLEGFRSSITRYAEPPWGAGSQAYGEALDAHDVLVEWTLGEDADHCDVCPDLADGGPYAEGELPTWPKAGDTPCFDNCYCTITAEPMSWNAAFPRTSYSEQEAA